MRVAIPRVPFCMHVGDAVLQPVLQLTTVALALPVGSQLVLTCGRHPAQVAERVPTRPAGTDAHALVKAQRCRGVIPVGDGNAQRRPASCLPCVVAQSGQNG